MYKKIDFVPLLYQKFLILCRVDPELSATLKGFNYGVVHEDFLMLKKVEK